jgi:hypothetical protein
MNDGTAVCHLEQVRTLLPQVRIQEINLEIEQSGQAPLGGTGPR